MPPPAPPGFEDWREGFSVRPHVRKPQLIILDDDNNKDDGHIEVADDDDDDDCIEVADDGDTNIASSRLLTHR